MAVVCREGGIQYRLEEMKVQPREIYVQVGRVKTSLWLGVGVGDFTYFWWCGVRE
jgi:hypothetical protein